MIPYLLACAPDLPRPITETGNPERVLGVATFDFTVPIETDPTIDSAWAALGETKFELAERYVGEHELEWETPELVADLAAGPADLRFRSPSAGYTRVEIRPRTGRDLPPGAPRELEEASFVVDGTRPDGVPFRIVSPSEREIVLTKDFELNPDRVELALGFDTDALLDGMDLSAAEVGPDGTIRISRGENRDLLEIFEENLRVAVVLVEDEDGDGEVSPSDPVLTEL